MGHEVISVSRQLEYGMNVYILDNDCVIKDTPFTKAMLKSDSMPAA